MPIRTSACHLSISRRKLAGYNAGSIADMGPRVMLMLFFITYVAFPQVNIGAGSYTLQNGGRPVPPSKPWVAADFTQKVNSANWFATLVSEPYSKDLWLHPLCVKAVKAGLEVGYTGTARGDAINISGPANKQLTLGVEGLNAGSAVLAGHSAWAVTARWSNGPRVLEATFGHGLPFVYCQLSGGNARIETKGQIHSWYAQGGVLGITIRGVHYGIFGPAGSIWTGSPALVSSLNGKNYFSIALLPDTKPQTMALFKKYAYSFVVDTDVSWAFDEAASRLHATFSFKTAPREGNQPGTLFALLRHQWLETVTGLTPYVYYSPRGLMKLGEGPSFSTVMNHNGILPAMPQIGYDKGVLDGYVKEDITCREANSTYAKPLGKMAVLAHIAEQAGNTAARNTMVTCLKAQLESWFTAAGDDRLFYYHKPWNRLIGYPAGFHSDTRLSDHHFHYGYFISAAAAIARFDKDWAGQTKWGAMVEMLIRDLNTWDKNDPLFAPWGYFDPYEGHGWADGMGFDRGNNQESSSESMNANAAIIMWGAYTGNKKIRDLGLFMHVMESRAIEQYWWDADHKVFPAEFPHSTVGMVWGNGGAYTTWFSKNAGAIHGINFLPITPGHLYLGRRPDYIPLNYREGLTGQWKDLFHMFMAFSDADFAWQQGNKAGIEGGNSQAAFYHHIKSLQAAGRLNTKAAASTPTFAVFDKDKTRTYTAYNPEDRTQLIQFNDGFTLSVPAHTQLTKQGPLRPLPLVPPGRPVKVKKPAARFVSGINGVITLPVQDEAVTGVAVYSLPGKKIGAWKVNRNNRKITLPEGCKNGIYLVKRL